MNRFLAHVSALRCGGTGTARRLNYTCTNSFYSRLNSVHSIQLSATTVLISTRLSSGWKSTIKSKIVAAREPGVDRTKIQDEVKSLQDQLRSIADSASFSDENWLSVDSSDANYVQVKSVVSSFTRTATSVRVETIDIDTATLELFDTADQSGIADSVFTTTGGAAVAVSMVTLDVSSAGIDNTDIDDMISAIDAKLAQLTSTASETGAAKKRISLQSDFVKTLMDTIDMGIGTLVDADISKESTRLQALQTQQQLGIQALSISNSSAQNILALFK